MSITWLVSRRLCKYVKYRGDLFKSSNCKLVLGIGESMTDTLSLRVGLLGKVVARVGFKSSKHNRVAKTIMLMKEWSQT
jgi:hypothetical protein